MLKIRLFICLIISAQSGILLAVEPVTLKYRAILDENFSWLRPEQADEVLEKVKAAGFNVFVPTVWHGRGVSWKTETTRKEPLWEDRANEVNDPLQTLIEKAHAEGIEVHPWFTVVLRQRDIFPEFSDGAPAKAFNIHNKDYRDFIIDLMLEVVSNYDIDGVNLDYIRSMGNCMSQICIDDYFAKTGRDLIADDKARWRDDDARDGLAAWNGPPLTDIVKRFSERARAIKQELSISVDTHPINRRITFEGANAIKWANLGYIDMIYDMQYKREINTEAYLTAKSRLKEPSKITLMIGNFERSKFNKSHVWPRQHDLVVEHIEQGVQLGKESRSIAVYEYPYLSEEQATALSKGPFKQYIER